MSTHLYAELKPPVPGLDPNASDRVELLRAQKVLESLAAELNVWPLTAYYSYHRASLEGLTDEKSLAAAPEEAEWFDPTRGLDTVRALRERLGSHAEGLDVRVEQALAELKDLQQILEAGQDGRFRLYPGP